eukprot:TRINITY_DN16991_c0_g1_i1.p1 TRINITY_DN16991_c0_g1~~TRINITY_DN16991_c0_g1_i1.p1  ORF type:complete len:128 (-),score=12.20 TRINITY_DN16991_c0_g1_i1:257-607(-)
MLGSLAVLLNLLFGGFLMSLHELPAAVNWVAHLSYVKYAYELLVVNEFGGAVDYKLTPFVPPGMKQEDLPFKAVTGDEILSIFYFDGRQTGWDLLGLVALALGYVALTSAVLHWRR